MHLTQDFILSINKYFFFHSVWDKGPKSVVILPEIWKLLQMKKLKELFRFVQGTILTLKYLPEIPHFLNLDSYFFYIHNKNLIIYAICEPFQFIAKYS